MNSEELNKVIMLVSNLSTEINLLQFELIHYKYGDDVTQIYNALIRSQLDKQCKGFWVWDIPNKIEYYSPQFRATLGFESEVDFPNIPESWMQQIHETDLKLAIYNYDRHVSTNGKYPYKQQVRYYTKNKKEISLLCLGKVVSWSEDEKPRIMIGLHL